MSISRAFTTPHFNNNQTNSTTKTNTSSIFSRQQQQRQRYAPIVLKRDIHTPSDPTKTESTLHLNDNNRLRNSDASPAVSVPNYHPYDQAIEYIRQILGQSNPWQYAKKNKKPNQDKDKDNDNDSSSWFKDPSPPGGPQGNPSTMGLFGFALFLGLLLLFMGGSAATDEHEISFREFLTQVLPRGDIAFVQLVNGYKVRVFLKSNPTHPSNDDFDDEWEALARGSSDYHFYISDPDEFFELLQRAEKRVGIPQSDGTRIVMASQSELKRSLINHSPLLVWLAFGIYAIRRMGRMGEQLTSRSGGPMSMTKSRAKMFQPENTSKISFRDVAGMEEPKTEIMEFVSFLKEPKRFIELGAKIPRGAILMGPPGTGKTLLAKAVASEAKVPFFSASGSDFVELFVGVGPARVRDLFAAARKHKPCIIYIDEIDAIGRPRGKSVYGANDERENTLNQLLVEMDGFQKNNEIIVMASTNVEKEGLDRALLRPGRFDRQIDIDRPELKERESIFQVHLTPLKAKESKDELARRLAKLTPGMTGADIANVCNEGALFAARKDKDYVYFEDLEAAIDRVTAGLERKTKVIKPEEKKVIAYHEAGHAIAAWFFGFCDPLLKISIIPRGSGALGFTQFLPKEDYIKTKEALEDWMCMALGGRVAEYVIFNHLSTGAQDDLQRVTRYAYAQVSTYGMSLGEVGHVSYPLFGEGDTAMRKPYSEETATVIDNAAREVVDQAFARTKELLEEKRDKLEQVAQYLLKNEIMHLEDFEKIVGPRPKKEIIDV